MADFLIPVGDHGEARTFIEFDLFGPNGTTVPRLKHFYAQLDNILVGQTFTNLMDPDALADTLDIPAPAAGVREWPIVGERIHDVWSRAHDDLPGLVKSMQPRIRELARASLAFVAGFGFSLGLCLRLGGCLLFTLRPVRRRPKIGEW